MDAAKQRSLSRLATRSTVNHLLPTSSKERLRGARVLDIALPCLKKALPFLVPEIQVSRPSRRRRAGHSTARSVLYISFFKLRWMAPMSRRQEAKGKMRLHIRRVSCRDRSRGGHAGRPESGEAKS